MQSLIPDEKEQARVYGKLLVDFANTRTTDEACLGLLKNIADIWQKACDCSHPPVFSDHKGFPSLSGLKASLSKQEKALLMSLLAEHKTKNFLAEHFRTCHGAWFKDYDSQKQTLACEELVCMAMGKWVDEEWVSTRDEVVEPRSIHINELRDEDWREMKPGTKTKVERLFKIGRIIDTFKNSISESRFSEIRRLSKDYPTLLSGHRYIETIQKKLKSVLLTYVPQCDPCGKSFLDHHYFSAQYNSRFSTKIRILPNVTPIEQDESDLWKAFYHKRYPHPKWYDAYESAVVFCLVRYLMTEKNKKLIRKCHKCQKLYTTEKAYTSKSGKYFCPDCGGDNRTREQNRLRQCERRARKKREKEEQQYKARIENLVESLGCTKKEAEAIIEADSRIDKGL